MHNLLIVWLVWLWICYYYFQFEAFQSASNMELTFLITQYSHDLLCSCNYIPRCVWIYNGFGLVAPLPPRPQTPCERDNSKTNEQNFMKLCMSVCRWSLLSGELRRLCKFDWEVKKGQIFSIYLNLPLSQKPYYKEIEQNGWNFLPLQGYCMQNNKFGISNFEVKWPSRWGLLHAKLQIFKFSIWCLLIG